MLARRIAAVTAIAVLTVPAAAHAAAHQGTHGPSATPLLVELGAVALVATVALTRRPIARAVRAAVAQLRGRRVRKPARATH